MRISSFQGIEVETQVGVGYMWQCGGIEEWSSLSVAFPFNDQLFNKNPVKKNTAELGKGHSEKFVLYFFLWN